MNLRIFYFASLREALGANREELAVPAQVRTVSELRAHLAQRGAAWEALTRANNLRCAVNQEMADPNAALKEGDEVAFFPPVTGG